MKAATGELQLTIITMIAIAAVIGFFWLAFPAIKDAISDQWGNVNCQEFDANGNCTQKGGSLFKNTPQ